MITERYPHLPKAPIVEALIDIRVSLRDDFDVMALKALHADVSHDYPALEEQRLVEGRVQFSEVGLSAAQGRSLRGFRVTGDEGRNIGQFRIDGFTFSRLAPYQTWDSLFEEGWRLWTLYRELARPLGISRLATRFINRLTLPDGARLEDYFTAPPDVPDGVPDTFAAFVYRYVLVPADGVTSSVTLATAGNTTASEQAPIVFDIDCYSQEDLPADAEPRMRARFQDLRTMKNRIFFKSMTSSALEAYR